MTRDAFRSLDNLISLGVERVLTSGLESSALEGAYTLKGLVEKAEDKIIVMPGAGINERNFSRLHGIVHAKEYHMGLSSAVKSKMEYHGGRVFMGGLLRQDEFSLSITGEDKVRKIKALIS